MFSLYSAPIKDFRIDRKALHLFFKRAPKEMARATAKLLNNEAFTFQELAPRVLDERYTIRNRSFLRSIFWVDKANSSEPPSSQKAIAGSIEKKNFSGFKEFVTGQEPKRNRLLGLNARRGSQTAKAKQENRLLSGAPLPGPKDFEEIPEHSRVAAMLRIMATDPGYTQGSRGKFIQSGGNWKPGVYRFRPGYQAKYSRSKTKGIRIKGAKEKTLRPSEGIQRIQTLDEAPKTQLFNWPQITIERLRTWFYPKEVWKKYFSQIVDKLR